MVVAILRRVVRTLFPMASPTDGALEAEAVDWTAGTVEEEEEADVPEHLGPVEAEGLGCIAVVDCP